MAVSRRVKASSCYVGSIRKVDEDILSSLVSSIERIWSFSALVTRCVLLGTSADTLSTVYMGSG